MLRCHERLGLQRGTSTPDKTRFYCLRRVALQHDEQRMYMWQISVRGKRSKERGPLLCDIKYSPEEKTLHKRYARVSIQMTR